jgi:uncharacterized membrane protein YcaP (DUF421 family)
MFVNQLLEFETTRIFVMMFSAIISYSVVMILLRIARKRTLSQMTAFDMIIPLTLGPILASTILPGGVTLIEGLTAFGFLVGLHSLVSRMTFRYPSISKLLEHDPVLLFYRGQFIDHNLSRENIAKHEIRQAVRRVGLAEMSNIRAVILEPTGSINVVQEPDSEVLTIPTIDKEIRQSDIKQ